LKQARSNTLTEQIALGASMQITPRFITPNFRSVVSMTDSAPTALNGSSSENPSYESSPAIWSPEDWAKFASDRDDRNRATQKIEDAKKELEFLKRAGFPPEILARLAGELARTVGTAAQQFSQGTGIGSATPSGPDAPIPEGIANASGLSGTVAATTKSDLNIEDGALAGEHADDSRQARQAYQTVMNDAPGTSSDEKIADDFKALLAEIKALIKQANREMQAGSVQGSTSGFNELTATSVAAGMPTSIVV
jgi:hypothetical protein